jgi:hypothetical protein
MVFMRGLSKNSENLIKFQKSIDKPCANAQRSLRLSVRPAIQPTPMQQQRFDGHREPPHAPVA